MLNTVSYNAIIYYIFHILLVTLICLRIKKIIFKKSSKEMGKILLIFNITIQINIIKKGERHGGLISF